MAARKAGGGGGGGQESQGVEVALAPEELELDPMAMTQKYEEHVREQQAQVEKEDFSDMVAEHAAKQKVRDETTRACVVKESLGFIIGETIELRLLRPILRFSMQFLFLKFLMFTIIHKKSNKSFYSIYSIAAFTICK